MSFRGKGKASKLIFVTREEVNQRRARLAASGKILLDSTAHPPDEILDVVSDFYAYDAEESVRLAKEAAARAGVDKRQIPKI